MCTEAGLSASVSREISKLHEETVRGTLAELAAHFSENIPRGEIVIVLGASESHDSHGTHRNKYRDSESRNHDSKQQ